MGCNCSEPTKPNEGLLQTAAKDLIRADPSGLHKFNSNEQIINSKDNNENDENEMDIDKNETSGKQTTEQQSLLEQDEGHDLIGELQYGKPNQTEIIINDEKIDVDKNNNNLKNINADKIDFSVIKQELYECDNVKNCTAINKLLVSLKYFELLDVMNKQKDRDLFCNFIQQGYPRIFDDYSHLAIKHSNEVNEIDISVVKCDDIEQCVFTQRHQNVAASDDKLDPKIKFYKHVMDSLHFFVCHLYHSGLRTANNDDELKGNDDKKNGEYFDKTFSRMTQQIKERQHLTKSFDRFQNNKNSKFSLIDNDDDECEDDT
eukprot:484958_1